ncbi:MAG: DNA-binding response regulator [Flavobacterium sp. BFFFF2]|nr:MAG: DNA-binding response regulator [Flavobacterium sp. BFFFF2]
MNIVIIEDEKPAARMLQRRVEAHGFEVVTLLHSVEEALQWFPVNAMPDLIFLDIQLSDGLSFELFDHLTLTSPVIFTTAYDEYALRAFKHNSVDYLLKPIDEDELARAIDKFRKWHATPAPVFDKHLIQNLFQESFSDQLRFKKRFSIKLGQHIKLIPIGEVVAFYSENKGTYLRARDGRDYLLEQTLEQLESELDPKQFFRMNRKYIVSMHAIVDIQIHSNSRLKLVLQNLANDDLIVSRERVSEFRGWLDA